MKEKQKKKELEEKLDSLFNSIKLIKKYNLNKSSLFTDFKKGVLRFLVDKIQTDDEFTEILFILIDLTKVDVEMKDAGSNAISLLNIANVDLRKKDFKGIKLQKAFLRGANLYASDFSDAVLD